MSRANAGAPARPIASTAPVAPTPKIDREEQREQQAGEGDRDVDAGVTSRPARRPSRNGAVPSSRPDDDRDRGRGERELDRQPGRDQRAVEDVAAEVVGADPVLGGRPGEDVAGVDGVRLVGPEDRRDDGEHQHADREHGRGRGPSGVRSTLIQRRTLSPPGSSSAGRAARAPRRRRCSRAARRRRRRARCACTTG